MFQVYRNNVLLNLLTVFSSKPAIETLLANFIGVFVLCSMEEFSFNRIIRHEMPFDVFFL